MDYILSQRLVNSCGNIQKTAGRSGRVIMTKEARVLRELRIQSGLSMRKAGALIGCTDSYISHIENGRADVRRGGRLDKFLAVYGGIKQKSFYERVRRHTFIELNKDQVITLLQELPLEELRMILMKLNLTSSI